MIGEYSIKLFDRKDYYAESDSRNAKPKRVINSANTISGHFKGKPNFFRAVSQMQFNLPVPNWFINSFNSGTPDNYVTDYTRYGNIHDAALFSTMQLINSPFPYSAEQESLIETEYVTGFVTGNTTTANPYQGLFQHVDNFQVNLVKILRKRAFFDADKANGKFNKILMCGSQNYVYQNSYIWLQNAKKFLQTFINSTVSIDSSYCTVNQNPETKQFTASRLDAPSGGVRILTVQKFNASGVNYGSNSAVPSKDVYTFNDTETDFSGLMAHEPVQLNDGSYVFVYKRNGISQLNYIFTSNAKQSVSFNYISTQNIITAISSWRDSTNMYSLINVYRENNKPGLILMTVPLSSLNTGTLTGYTTQNLDPGTDIPVRQIYVDSAGDKLYFNNRFSTPLSQFLTNNGALLSNISKVAGMDRYGKTAIGKYPLFDAYPYFVLDDYRAFTCFEPKTAVNEPGNITDIQNTSQIRILDKYDGIVGSSLDLSSNPITKTSGEVLQIDYQLTLTDPILWGIPINSTVLEV